MRSQTKHRHNLTVTIYALYYINFDVRICSLLIITIIKLIFGDEFDLFIETTFQAGDNSIQISDIYQLIFWEREEDYTSNSYNR